MLVGLLGMLIRNAPGEVPWPRNPIAWSLFFDSLSALAAGFIAFLICAWLLARYMPRTRLFRGLELAPAAAGDTLAVSATAAPAARVQLRPGLRGVALSPLRPAGQARFADTVADVVSQGDFIAKDAPVEILNIQGNRIVVRPTAQGG